MAINRIELESVYMYNMGRIPSYRFDAFDCLLARNIRSAEDRMIHQAWSKLHSFQKVILSSENCQSFKTFLIFWETGIGDIRYTDQLPFSLF